MPFFKIKKCKSYLGIKAQLGLLFLLGIYVRRDSQNVVAEAIG